MSGMGIVIEAKHRPWDFNIVETVLTNKKFKRVLSDPQIVLCYMLVALFSPRGLSQRGLLAWLIEYVHAWAGNRSTVLHELLTNLSHKSLDRYLDLANSAQLIIADDLKVSFGGQVYQNRDNDLLRQRFASLPLYADQANAEWIATALGIEFPARGEGEGEPEKSYGAILNIQNSAGDTVSINTADEVTIATPVEGETVEYTPSIKITSIEEAVRANVEEAQLPAEHPYKQEVPVEVASTYAYEQPQKRGVISWLKGVFLPRR